MGLNDPRSTNKVVMWNTWNLAGNETVEHMVATIALAAGNAPGGKLRNLVFRCHGAPGYLQLGAGVRRTDLHKFQPLRGLVDKIWLSACRVGYITPGAGASPGPAAGNGHAFCSELARAVQCYVVASTELQVIGTNRILPPGCLDTFEGLVLSYGPTGAITWRHRYPSTYQRASGGWTRNPD